MHANLMVSNRYIMIIEFLSFDLPHLYLSEAEERSKSSKHLLSKICPINLTPSQIYLVTITNLSSHFWFSKFEIILKVSAVVAK